MTVTAAPEPRWRATRVDRALVVEERHVTAQHEDVAVERVELGERDLDRAARAGHVVLIDDVGFGRIGEHGVRDQVALVPDDDEDARGSKTLRGGEHVPDQRAAADAMQHLRQRRFHARALPCGEDDHGERRVGDGV